MDYLVTGASGLVGNNVVRSLLDRGKRVRVMVRESTDSRPFEGLDVEKAHADLRDAEAIERCMEGVQFVVHAAADIHIGWQHLERQREVNVVGSGNVAKAARRVGARLVHVSSVDALAAGSAEQPVNEETADHPKLPCTYVVTKREAEEAVRAEQQEGLDAIIVNPGFMMGPWDWKPSSGRMLLAIATRWTPAAPVGGMSLCDVRDVADGIVTALHQGESGRRYILAGENISYLEAWRLFARITERPGPRFRMGPLIRWGAGWFGDLATKVTGREGEVNSALIGMSSLFHYYDSSRAMNELGYRVRSTDETVRDSWEWLKKYGYT